VAEPAGDPPLVHVVGAEVCGPKTVKVIVPAALAPDDDPNVATIDAAATGPAVAVAGALTDRVGLAVATTVSDMPEPHVEVAVPLFESPLYDAYHQ
jgi:hypothetical protein